MCDFWKGRHGHLRIVVFGRQSVNANVWKGCVLVCNASCQGALDRTKPALFVLIGCPDSIVHYQTPQCASTLKESKNLAHFSTMAGPSSAFGKIHCNT